MTQNGVAIANSSSAILQMREYFGNAALVVSLECVMQVYRRKLLIVLVPHVPTVMHWQSLIAF